MSNIDNFINSSRIPGQNKLKCIGIHPFVYSIYVFGILQICRRQTFINRRTIVLLNLCIFISLVKHSILVGQVSSVEIERICNEVDSNILETAAIGVPLSGGGPEQLVIAVVFRNSDSETPDLNHLKMSLNSALQKKLNPLFRVLISVEFQSFHLPSLYVFYLAFWMFAHWCRFLVLCHCHLFLGRQLIRLWEEFCDSN